MKHRSWGVLLLSAALAAPVGALTDDHGKEKDHDRDERGTRHGDRDHDRDHRRDPFRALGNGHYRHHDHDGDADDRRPPGWNKGKKTGWGNCNLPPGQAKKYGCEGSRGRGEYRSGRRPVVRTPHVHARVQGSAGVEVH